MDVLWIAALYVRVENTFIVVVVDVKYSEAVLNTRYYYVCFYSWVESGDEWFVFIFVIIINCPVRIYSFSPIDSQLSLHILILILNIVY